MMKQPIAIPRKIFHRSSPSKHLFVSDRLTREAGLSALFSKKLSENVLNLSQIELNLRDSKVFVVSVRNCDIGTMGWVWRDDVEDTNSISGDVSKYERPPDRCSTRRIMKSHCRTEEVEPGKFVRKCEKTEEILLNCVGKPVEVVQSNKEYTEDDVTEEVRKGSSSLGFSNHAVFDFPGLQSDIDAIGRSFLGNVDRFFHAAEETKKGFFGVFDDAPYASREFPSWSRRSGIPIEDHRLKESSPRSGERKFSLDFFGMVKDV